jgi:hypothetical protein
MLWCSARLISHQSTLICGATRLCRRVRVLAMLKVFRRSFPPMCCVCGWLLRPKYFVTCHSNAVGLGLVASKLRSVWWKQQRGRATIKLLQRASPQVDERRGKWRFQHSNYTTTNHCTRPATVRSFLAPFRGRVNSAVLLRRAAWLAAEKLGMW